MGQPSHIAVRERTRDVSEADAGGGYHHLVKKAALLVLTAVLAPVESKLLKQLITDTKHKTRVTDEAVQ